MIKYEEYEKPARNFCQAGEGETIEVEIIKPEINKAQDEEYSDTITVKYAGEQNELSLPVVLKGYMKAMIEDGTLKAGTKLRIENLGKVKKKKYFDFKVGHA